MQITISTLKSHISDRDARISIVEADRINSINECSSACTGEIERTVSACNLRIAALAAEIDRLGQHEHRFSGLEKHIQYLEQWKNEAEAQCHVLSNEVSRQFNTTLVPALSCPSNFPSPLS